LKELAAEDGMGPLGARLDHRIQTLQRRAMDLASRVYGGHRYPRDYWVADQDREYLVELLSAWQRWNDPDYAGPVPEVA